MLNLLISIVILLLLFVIWFITYILSNNKATLYSSINFKKENDEEETIN